MAAARIGFLFKLGFFLLVVTFWAMIWGAFPAAAGAVMPPGAEACDDAPTDATYRACLAQAAAQQDSVKQVLDLRAYQAHGVVLVEAQTAHSVVFVEFEIGTILDLAALFVVGTAGFLLFLLACGVGIGWAIRGACPHMVRFAIELYTSLALVYVLASRPVYCYREYDDDHR